MLPKGDVLQSTNLRGTVVAEQIPTQLLKRQNQALTLAASRKLLER